jgi:hypothetical protein
VSELPRRNELPDQLEALRLRLEGTNPALYRHLALYLQVLRQILPHSVEQACFHLATQVHPRRYAALPGREREELHRRRQVLVQRCCSLLTVEQVASLAAQIHRERGRQERQAQRRLLESLETAGPSRPSAEGQLPDEDSPFIGPSHGSATDSADDPATGSVQLGLSLPLSPGWLGWGPGSPPSPGGTPHSLPGQPVDGRGGSGGAEDATGSEDADGSAAEPEAARVMLRAFADALSDGVGGQLDDLLTSDPESAELSPWQQGRLPREPPLLLHWLDGMERALARRLRNLSHALNVELLRVGVSRTLLPVSLLDAVLSGQLEAMAAPANVLHLQLPFGTEPGPGPAQVMALLLRCGDLEMEEPRLRTCRRRLQQHRQEVRRMAGQFRHLERRLQAHQAEELWLQDIRTTRPPSD